MKTRLEKAEEKLDRAHANYKAAPTNERAKIFRRALANFSAAKVDAETAPTPPSLPEIFGLKEAQ